MNEQRTEFVRKCGELLHTAKPNLISCELKLGKDITDAHAKVGHPTLVPDAEYVVVTCENGCTYNLCVEANSLCGIATEIFSKMLYK